ncbi:hypothetical protein ERO13_D08G092932v2 [Gossypium hirsutum]|nr:hypothetical protein ERO13_D08G092932v2 [Gossypium hirsutum]
MNLLVILGLDGGTTSTAYISMPIILFSDAFLGPLLVLSHAVTSCSNHNSVATRFLRRLLSENEGKVKLTNDKCFIFSLAMEIS